MGRHYHRLTTAQFAALYRTAVATDGMVRGNARTQRFLIDCGYVTMDWAATHAAGETRYRMNSSSWHHLDTHIYWLTSRGSGRSEFETGIVAAPRDARMALSKAQNATYQRASKERP